MIVVVTPTGSIGSKLLPLLLAAGERVRVIARDPSKLAPAIAARVEVVQGAADDPAVVHRAFEGAESVFWVVPPSLRVTDVKGYYLGFTRPAAEAVRAHGVKRVVGVSSLGRGLGIEAGIISATHAKDALLESTGVAYRALWNPGFMDNLLTQLEPLKQHGVFSLPARGDLKTPCAATRDIAASGARLLLDRSWSGTGGLAVLGPEDLSPNDQAAVMTAVLGREIRFQPITGAVFKERLMQHGASEAMADALVAMHAAIAAGLHNSALRTPENTTPTGFRQWCNEVLKPAMQG